MSATATKSLVLLKKTKGGGSRTDMCWPLRTKVQLGYYHEILDYIRGKKKLSEHVSNDEIYTLIKTKLTPS